MKLLSSVIWGVVEVHLRARCPRSFFSPKFPRWRVDDWKPRIRSDDALTPDDTLETTLGTKHGDSANRLLRWSQVVNRGELRWQGRVSSFARSQNHKKDKSSASSGDATSTRHPRKPSGAFNVYEPSHRFQGGPNARAIPERIWKDAKRTAFFNAHVCRYARSLPHMASRLCRHSQTGTYTTPRRIRPLRPCPGTWRHFNGRILAIGSACQ